VNCKERYSKDGRKKTEQESINERKRNPENKKTEKRQSKVTNKLRKK